MVAHLTVLVRSGATLGTLLAPGPTLKSLVARLALGSFLRALVFRISPHPPVLRSMNHVIEPALAIGYFLFP